MNVSVGRKAVESFITLGTPAAVGGSFEFSSLLQNVLSETRPRTLKEFLASQMVDALYH
jgi:hypothetical protein